MKRSTEHTEVKDKSCQNYLEICCEFENQLHPADLILPTRLSGGIASIGTGNTDGTGTGGTGTSYVTRGCGHRNPEGIGLRITGNEDSETQFGEFPWMVGILQEEPVKGSTTGEKINYYQCAGALIHPRAVLTAAHCVSKKIDKVLKIRAGEWDTEIKTEFYGHQDRYVESVIIHPHFHAGALFNDVALLILKTPVDLEQNVDLICLPPNGTVIDSQKCIASGWGNVVFKKFGRKYQPVLKKVELSIVQNAKCEESLRNTLLGTHFILDKTFICAGGLPGRHTCKGDGGSPLVCPITDQKDRYYQAGIVAWGIGCGGNNTPGVYANVAYQRAWIDEQMEYQRLDKEAYSY